MTKIVAISDLHGNLPEIPECDILLLGGDYVPHVKEQYQAVWFETIFKPWLDQVPVKEIVGVAGNHDLIFERPEFQQTIHSFNWNYLLDSSIEVFGLKIYGMPWQRRFFDWAFNLDEEDLAAKARQIEDCDIYLGHGPAYALGDFVPSKKEYCGCQSLTERLVEINPLLAVYGHIHEGYGKYRHRVCDTIFANASLVDRRYRVINQPLVFNF